MNGHEKSGPVIVAVKPANEAGGPAEEWAEPSTGAGGNAREQSTFRAQHRVDVSPALDRSSLPPRRRICANIGACALESFMILGFDDSEIAC